MQPPPVSQTIEFFHVFCLNFRHSKVILNDLIICLAISKTDFSLTNSFPLEAKG